MENVTAQEFLDNLKPLTGSQFDAMKGKVKSALLKDLGKEPDRKSVTRDMGALLGPEDWLAILVFIAAFVVSAIHIMSLVGGVASNLTTEVISQGIEVTPSLFVKAHQIAFVLLAEFAMILFMVRWRLAVRHRQAVWETETEGLNQEQLKLRPRGRLGDFLSIDLCLALLAAGFILYANLESKLPILESIMPPLFTIGIGIHLEHVFVEMLHRRKILASLLAQKIKAWQEAVQEVTSSSTYKRLLVRTIWESLMAIPGNSWAADAPDQYKWMAVEREFKKETWFDQHLQVQSMASPKAITAVANGEWGLPGLIEVVVSADENATDRVEIGHHWVDLGELTWFNGDKKKSYGPYSSRSRMVGGMKMAMERGGIQTSAT